MAAEKMLQKSIQLALVALVSTPLVACASSGKLAKVAPAPPAPPAAATQERVLLADDFKSYSPRWRQVRGQWGLMEGALLQARDSVTELNTILFYDPLTVADAEITADLSVITDMPQFLTASDEGLLAAKRRVAGAGIVFRYQDEDNFYMFRTAGEEGVVFGKVIDGEWHELANPRSIDFAGVLLKSDTPYRLRVRLTGNRIQCWIGNKAVVNLEDRSLATGRVGLTTFRSKAAFTGLRVVER
jgi:hypothetical protein